MILGLVVIAVAVSGCAAAGSAKGTPAAAAKSQAGTTLTLASTEGPPSLNPALGGTRDPNDYWDDLAYDPLIYREPNGSLAPAIAAKWGYVGTGNGTFSLTLRSGVGCSDGTVLTAADVKQNFAYWAKALSPWSYVAQNFASVDVTGPLSLTIKLKAADPNLPTEFTEGYATGDIICPGGLSNPASLGTSTDGAGQYMLDAAATITNQTYTYVPNPHYWDKAALHWQKVVVSVIANPDSQLASMQSGQVDFTDGTSAIATAAKSAGFQVDATPNSVSTFWIRDRYGKGVKALGSLQVREALSDAIDRPALTKAIYGAYAQPADQIQLPGTEGYSAALNDYYTYDPAKAKALLKQAGYPSGFSFTMFVFPGSQPEINMAQELAAEWASIGVHASINVPSSIPQYVADINGTTLPAIPFAFPSTPMMLNFSGRWSASAQSASNPYKVHDAQLDALAAQAGTATPAQATALYGQMETRVTELAWELSIADVDLVTIARPGLTGFEPNSEYLDPDPIFFQAG